MKKTPKLIVFSGLLVRSQTPECSKVYQMCQNVLKCVKLRYFSKTCQKVIKKVSISDIFCYLLSEPDATFH